MKKSWIAIGIIIVLVVGYLLLRPWPFSGNTHTATSTGGTYTVTSPTDAPLTVESAQQAIVGSWTSTGAPASFTFAANGMMTSAVGSAPSQTGVWKLYTSVDVPADLSRLIFEPNRVFIRITTGKTHQDYLVWRVDATGLSMGPIGQGGSLTFSRGK